MLVQRLLHLRWLVTVDVDVVRAVDTASILAPALKDSKELEDAVLDAGGRLGVILVVQVP